MYNLSGLGELRKGGNLVKRFLAGMALVGALLAPTTAAVADERPGAGVEICSNSGYIGVWAWYYDLQNNYHRIWTCIYIGP